MRVISGIAKSRKIKMNSNLNIRPVSDRIKQSLFEIIKNEILDLRVLDLYAGTGSLGLEALSRGAKEVAFVDNNLGCIRLIKENVNNLGFTQQSKIIKEDVNIAIKKLYKNNDKFDIILIDPPYLKGAVKKTLQNLSNNDILNTNGLIIVKHHKKESGAVARLLMKLDKERVYGDTILSFLRKVNNESR